MTEFNSKKEKLVSLIEGYINDNRVGEELRAFAILIRSDVNFRDKALFVSICNEIEFHLKELTQRELKQRVLLIRSFME